MSRRKTYLGLAIFGMLIAAILGYILIATFRVSKLPDIEQTNQEPTTHQQTSDSEPELPEPTHFNAHVLQQTIDDWVTNHAGTYGIVVQDPRTKDTLATYNQHQTFFTASLYKLYMAFLVWQDLDSGDIEEQANFYEQYSLNDCLDRMIRLSDSPCGEAVLAAYDYASVQKRLLALGMPDINMPGFQVSAADMAVLLQHIYDHQLIPETSAQSLRQSMREQIYDKGLKSGFNMYLVEDKVGFSENGDWHDVGLVKVGDDYLIVAVLSNKAYSANLAGLATSLQNTLESL
ncbi:serine hydrolase [Candidatus Saccharibacteria bacterium]|nr:serine hydrolase [Candidatus Saccharibacteria bacterium]